MRHTESRKSELKRQVKKLLKVIDQGYYQEIYTEIERLTAINDRKNDKDFYDNLTVDITLNEGLTEQELFVLSKQIEVLIRTKHNKEVKLIRI